MSLPCDREAIIADRSRVWEVRRYCQIAKSPYPQGDCGENDFPRDAGTVPEQKGDAALSALLRCLIYELDADITAVTLLDDNTQHFLSVVQRSSLHDPSVTVGSTQWYGCHSISHHGGLCARTITMEDPPGSDSVFEIFDLSARDDTRSLPVVDGTAASFRHYAGVPIKTVSSVHIGTLFIFKNKPAQQSLPPAHRHFICETARHAVGQLAQAVEALDSKRAIRCNSAILSLLDVCEPGSQSNPLQRQKTPQAPGQYTTSASSLYQSAAKLLSHAFELEGVIIQELPLPNSATNSKQPHRQRLLAEHYVSEDAAPGHIADSVVEQLLEAFPSGAIFHLLSGAGSCGMFATSVRDGLDVRKDMRLDLCKHFPTPEQFLFLPLWDTFHDRDVAFILGWATGFTRVYSSTTDFSPLASFGMAVMTQVHRLEAQMVARSKSDFLGSISHEMRSPLHGVLACMDLLLSNQCSTEQLDLLESAESCGLQLRDNIDNILRYSNIGSPSSSLEQPKRPGFPPRKEIQRPATLRSNTGERQLHESKYNMLTLVEETIKRDSRKSKSMTPTTKRHFNSLSIRAEGEAAHRLIGSAYQTIIVVDATSSANFPLVRSSDISIVINNLLVSRSQGNTNH